MEQQFELISTHRLDLYCLTGSELLSMCDDPKLFANRSFKNPYGVITRENLPRANRIEDVRKNPENIRWYYRVIVDRERNLAVGSISFHGAPDERGMVEVGLGIAQPERGKGFASEALSGMWTWVAHEPTVKFLRYTVSPANVESMSIIKNFGFPKIGEQVDEEDGLELIFESSVRDYLDWI